MTHFEVPVFFVTKAFQEAVVQLNINLIEPKALNRLLHAVSVNDVAYNVVLDEVVRSHHQLQEFAHQRNLFNNLTSQTDLLNEVSSHIAPLYNSLTFKEKVLETVRGDIALENTYMMDDFPSYHLAVVEGSLLIGCDDGFFSTFATRDKTLKFYRNCLELCQSTIPGKDLNHSVLFSKFVKLSISI